MGTANSCLPKSLRYRRSVSKLKHESLNNNPMNINQVSEDELLLLPGITRQIAQNIVEYRERNNGFRRVKEVLQVNGITSYLLKRIHTDLTIDSLSDNKQERLNLNFASYNELCLVPGLTSELVTRIIQRRKQKGLFHFVEDLLKIKGIDYIVLATIRPHVTVECTVTPRSMSYSSAENRETDIFSSTILPVKYSEQKTFRFASWNLQQLTNEKVQDPDIREIICRVILENNLSIIGIQGIGNEECLDFIVQELNTPTIPIIVDWPKRHQGKWKCIISDIAGQMFEGNEYLGFLYDESIGILLEKAALFPSNIYFTRSPFITIFRVFNQLELVFINIHLKVRRLDEDENERTKDEAKSFSVLTQAMKNSIEQKHVIIFGNFNLIPTAPEFEALVKDNYSYVFQQNTNTDMQTPHDSTCEDNIWLSSEAKALNTKNSGIIRNNLTITSDSTGSTSNSLVNNHYSIWIELNLS